MSAVITGTYVKRLILVTCFFVSLFSTATSSKIAPDLQGQNPYTVVKVIVQFRTPPT